MKQTFLWLLLLCCLQACNNKQEQKTNEDKAILQDQIIPLDTLGDWVKIVMNKQKDGILRGFSIGTSLDSVKKREKAKILEENSTQNYVTYTFDVDEDMIDIIYRYDNNRKIKAFEVLAIVNGVESFIQDFTTYYTLRYGNPQQKNDTLQVWRSSQGYQVKLIKSNRASQARIVIE